jgi:hypothetical protein
MNQTANPLEEDFDLVYDKIASLYDHAENILKTAYHDSVTDHEAFLAEIEPLVQQIEESANVIAEDFSNIIESGERPTNAVKIRVNSALRRILLQIEEFRAKVQQFEKSGA